MRKKVNLFGLGNSLILFFFGIIVISKVILKVLFRKFKLFLERVFKILIFEVLILVLRK